jgi:hypothetical protein
VRQRLLRELIHVDPTRPVAPPAAPSRGQGPTVAELNELFLAANADERRLILLNLPYAPLRLATRVPPAVARESIHRLEAAALGHNTEVFARELERTLRISRETARRVIDDPSGEPIVVAAVVLGMKAAVLQRILICLNPAIGQSVQRVYELALLYEEIDLQAALRLLAIWQDSHAARKAKPAIHQPQLWQSERDATAATPAARPYIRSDEQAPTRRAERT